jgi:hypothetical protein
MRATFIAAMMVAVTGLAGTSLTNAVASASSVPVVYVNGQGGSNFVHGKVRPTGNLYWTCDGSGWFTMHSWNSWTGTNARGSATGHLRAGGINSPVKTVHTTLHFYRVRTHKGQRYFTRLHFTFKHKLDGIRSATLRSYAHGCSAWYY